MTTTGIKYPGTVTQNTASSYIQWNNINNIKTGSNSSQTQTMAPNATPAPITCTDFSLGLPSYNRISKIEFTYKHRVNPNPTGKYPTFDAPDILLYDGGTLIATQKGLAPGKNMQEVTLAFRVSWLTDHQNPARNLKIVVKYPKNVGTYSGAIELQWCIVKVTYTAPSFLLQITKTGDTYTNQGFSLKVTVDDKNGSDLKVPLTVTIPSGMEVTDSSDGTDILVNEGHGVYRFKVQCANTGTYDVTATMATGETKTLSVEVTNRPTSYNDDEVFDEEQIYYATDSTEFILPIELNSEIDYTGITNVYFWCDRQLQYKTTGSYTTLNANTKLTLPLSLFSNYLYNLKLKTTTGINKIYLSLGESMPSDATYVIYTVPSAISSTYPIMTVIKLSEAETDLLSDGSVYTIDSEFLVERITSGGTFTDYYRNYRLGVVNQSVNESTTTIFEACRNWSTSITYYDLKELKSVEFTYNDDYPVYIIITGDYNYGSSLTKCQLTFTPPFFYLSEDERPVSYDIVQLSPLHNTISDTQQASIQMTGYQSTAPFTIYNYTVDEELQTSDHRAIRGVELYGYIQTTQTTTVTAILRSNEDDEHSKSTIITTSGEFRIGNSYDLWGYSVGDMVDLSDWEVQIQVANNFANNTNDIILNGLYLKVYYVDVDAEVVTVKVNGEDLRWYNAYLTDLKIPLGLNMETQYMEIAGKDTNKPVNQAVRSKEITASLIVDGCDITETTQLVKQLNQLLVTERDSMNMPIPNILEFSNRPGEHYEYILEDEFDADITVASYETDIKFIIPDGASYSNDDTVTGPIGRVNSITKVNPIITVANIQTDNLEITEENTGQVFTINYPFTDEDIIEIDCLTRTVELNPIDEEEYGTELKTFVDINSDWFYLNNEYSFTCETAIIQSVRYNERG